ncbi:ComF family protein [Paroceanicella profunda]|uniref:ComF family protein n=2 Tax=Paroceanicella profunda TaxID=2579971 RepID=A0A5B8G466_9RHOB|nr:ComF family protein [Paroceanicella profunda]
MLDLVYPPVCIACAEPVESQRALCAACWRDTQFLTGALCEGCASPVEGAFAGPDLHCARCSAHPPPWDIARAAIAHEGPGRRLILSLKHSGRLELAKPIAGWMARAGADLLDRADVIAPVPLHWLRLARRGHNQSAELARALARLSGKPVVLDLLARHRHTPSQVGRDLDARAANLAGAIAPGPRHSLTGLRILLVDDVMTTGATLTACATACLAGGAAGVDVLAAARALAPETRVRPPG